MTTLTYGLGFLLMSAVIEVLGPGPFRHYLSLPKAYEMFRAEHSSLGVKYVMNRLMSYLGILMVLLGALMILMEHLGVA